jgi:hypothetical protein
MYEISILYMLVPAFSLSHSLTSRADKGFSRNYVRTRSSWRPPQYYISLDDQTHMVHVRIYEMGVVTEPITTLRLYIVTDLRKDSIFLRPFSSSIQSNTAALRVLSLAVGMKAIIGYWR